jgi:uncharacterized membrane protein YozB (DUF420 family)
VAAPTERRAVTGQRLTQPSSGLRSRLRGGRVAPRRASRAVRAFQWLLVLATAAALIVDAVVHLRDAHFYDGAAGGWVTEGQLFRAQAAVALLVAGWLLLRRRPVSWLTALLVAASAFAAVLLYRYVNVGQLGPLPRMYEPSWDAPGKLPSAYAEGTGAVLAALGLLLAIRSNRRQDPSPPTTSR